MRMRQCAMALILLLAGLWPLGPARAARADRRVLAILNRVAAKTAAVKTLTADFTYTVAFPDRVRRDMGTVTLRKPNEAAIVLNLHAPSYRRVISDGTTLWTFSPPSDSYQKEAADPKGQNIHVWDSLIVQAFFNVFTAVKQSVYTKPDLSDLHYAGTEQVDDVTYQVLEHRMIGTITGGAQSPFVQRIYVGPDDLIHRYVLKFQQNGRPGSEVAELEDVKTGVSLSAADFAFTPPESAIPDNAPAAKTAPLTTGTPAPDFSALDRADAALSPAEYRGQVVLLDFWATWWAPKSEPTAHIQQLADLARKYADQNVVVVVVDMWDTAAAWQAWLREHPEITGITLLRDPALRGKDAASTLYGVSVLPTTFVIDKAGNIAGAVAGDTDSTAPLENVLSSLGIAPTTGPSGD